MGKNAFFNRISPVFTPDGIDRLAAYCKDNWPEDTAHVLRTAQEACRNQFLFDFRWDMERTWQAVQFEKEIDWSLIPNGDREFLWQFNRTRFLLCLAQAYCLTGEECFAGHFVRLMTDWMERVQEGENIDLGPWRTLETGIRGEIWLRSLALLEGAQAVGEEFISKAEACLEAHAVRLLENFSLHKYISNWGVLESSGLLLLSIALEEGALKEQCRSTALERMERAAQVQVLRDGAQWEQSPMYHNEVYHCLLNAFYYGRRAGLKLPETLPDTLRRMAWADVIWMKPDHTQFTQGDSDATDLRDQITAGAFVLRDGGLKAFGYECLDYESAWQFGYEACLAYDRMKAQSSGFTSAELPVSGNYYFRSGWERDANLLHFHCGDTGGGHGHADKLHVDLVVNGEDVLSDSGRYTYVDGAERYMLKEPGAHNVVLVDEVPFSSCETSWIYRKLCTCLKQQYFDGRLGAYVEGSHLGYQDRGILSNRRVIWIKPDIYVIVDSFYGEGEHTYEALFHFDRNGMVKETERGAEFCTERTAVWLQTLQPGAERGIRVTEQSYHYNEAGENRTFYEREKADGCYTRITVLNGGAIQAARPVKAERLSVFSCVHDRALDRTAAEVLRITSGSREYVLFVCHREVMTPTDILRWENCIGYGRAVLFDRSVEKEALITGEVLAW